MYFEYIAELTRDHIRTHLGAYLSDANTGHTKKTALVMPKSFEASSYVGGLLGVTRDTLPALAVNADNKEFSGSDEDLFVYLYTGQIAGMVTSGDALDVERQAKRYAALMELFVKEHLRLPHDDALPFRIIEFAFQRVTFFGAADIQEQSTGKNTNSYWIDGFLLDISWLVSEMGPGQHA